MAENREGSYINYSVRAKENVGREWTAKFIHCSQFFF